MPGEAKRITMAKGETERRALTEIAGAPEGLTANQLGKILWPESAKTHLPAGRVIANLRIAGWVTRSVYGVAQISEAGVDRVRLSGIA